MLTVSPRSAAHKAALLLVLASLTSLTAIAAPQTPTAKPAEKTAQPAQSAGKAAPSPLQAALGGILQGLKASPGCLGQQVAQTQEGKGLIFAWFKNKKATLDWYRSQTHTRLMGAMQSPTRPPLENIKDENIPILVIASLTPSERPDPGQKMPVAQIAVELYTPLPGGFSYGGRFAPETVKVQGLLSAPRNTTPPAAPPQTPAPKAP